jgi:CheY-like chemotaxis protein
LTQLVDTLLDRAALRQRCSLLQTELTKMGKRLDDLEQQNQTLDDQISRSGLKRTDHSRFPVVTHHLQRRDVVDGIEERRNHGPAVRRVTIDCRSDDPVLPPERVAAGQRHLSQQMPTPSHDVSDESQLTGRVLIVDDVPGNRRLASFLLEHAGATVVQADCGQEMLELFEAAASSGQTFDSVVLHMAMQEMDGYECARQLRLRGYCGPIIAAMACSLPLDRHLCVSAGCDEFVTMPLDRNQFIRTVRRMLKAAPMTSESR